MSPCSMMAAVAAALLVFLSAGCSTHNTTLAREAGGTQVIYRLSEEQAFRMAMDAFAEVLPNQSLYDITGGRRGYYATWRFGLDTYSQRILVVPAVGTDATGHEVKGFWFDVSGSGTAIISGAGKNRELYQRIQEALEAGGTGVAVTNLRDGIYETDGQAHRAGGRDASQAATVPRPQIPGGGIVEKLRELKTMHESGLITDQEYEAKRRELLNRM
jgi:Short C-terminal domain